MYIYITVKPDGALASEVKKNRPDYKEVQKYVGGIMQIVPYFSSLEYDGKKYNRGTAYCNEEGWLLGLPPNPLASACWMKACPKGDPERMHIAGTLLFVAKVKDEPSVQTS
jgi:hypothetical protein